MREDVWMTTLASGVANFVHFGMLIALLVVSAVVIRRHRPDAWTPFMFASLIDLVGSFSRVVLTTIGPAIVMRSSGGMGTFWAATTLLSTCFSIGFWVFLLVGLVRVAKPYMDAIPNAPPYR